MMAKKAELFGDENTKRKVLSSKTPGEAKTLGRSVAGFDDVIWLPMTRGHSIQISGKV